MKRPDKKEYSIEPKSPYQSGLVEDAYIMALEKYVDHLEHMFPNQSVIDNQSDIVAKKYSASSDLDSKTARYYDVKHIWMNAIEWLRTCR